MTRPSLPNPGYSKGMPPAPLNPEPWPLAPVFWPLAPLW